MNFFDRMTADLLGKVTESVRVDASVRKRGLHPGGLAITSDGVIGIVQGVPPVGKKKRKPFLLDTEDGLLEVAVGVRSATMEEMMAYAAKLNLIALVAHAWMVEVPPGMKAIADRWGFPIRHWPSPFLHVRDQLDSDRFAKRFWSGPVWDALSEQARVRVGDAVYQHGNEIHIVVGDHGNGRFELLDVKSNQHHVNINPRRATLLDLLHTLASRGLVRTRANASWFVVPDRPGENPLVLTDGNRLVPMHRPSYDKLLRRCSDPMIKTLPNYIPFAGGEETT